MEELKEAVEYSCGLIDHFEAVKAKMPKKCNKPNCEDIPCFIRNETIDQCTLAFAGMIPEKKEQTSETSIASGLYDKGWNACREAILK